MTAKSQVSRDERESVGWVGGLQLVGGGCGERVKNRGTGQEGAGYSSLLCLGCWCFCTLGKGPTPLREYHPEAPSKPQTSGEHVGV